MPDREGQMDGQDTNRDIQPQGQGRELIEDEVPPEEDPLQVEESQGSMIEFEHSFGHSTSFSSWHHTSGGADAIILGRARACVNLTSVPAWTVGFSSCFSSVGGRRLRS